MIKKIMASVVTICAVIVFGISIFGIKEAFSLTTTPRDKYIAKSTTKTASVNSTKFSSNTYNVLVMGDSLAKGTGDENGKGFGGYFSDYLKSKKNKNVKTDNIAINGDVSNGLLKVVQNKDNNDLIKNANIIFISIGGNEIKEFRSESSLTSIEVKSVENNYLNNIRNIFKIIRNENSKCMVIFIGLYNPFGTDINSDKVQLLNSWNYDTQNIVTSDSNSVFVPTYDIFQYNIKKYLTIDNFHPNSSGYKAIAERVEQILQNYNY